MDDKLHQYRKNFGSYAFRTAIHVVPAIALGLIVDKACEFIQKKLEIGPLIMIIVQLIVMIIVLFIVEKYVSVLYADEWQSNTPGLFFVSFFFGLQLNLFSNISILSKKAQEKSSPSP